MNTLTRPRELIYTNWTLIEPEFDPGKLRARETVFTIGGEMLEAALSALRLHGRIIACGGISGYNAEMPQPGLSNLFNITTKRLTMKGLIVGDWLSHQSEFEREVGGYFRAGKLKNKQTVVVGIDKAVSAFLGLFTGKNIGKMVVKLE